MVLIYDKLCLVMIVKKFNGEIFKKIKKKIGVLILLIYGYKEKWFMEKKYMIIIKRKRNWSNLVNVRNIVYC